MAYNSSKYQLTKLLQDAWARMGQMRTWTITGGSTTTVVNTDWSLSEEPVYEDDDPSLIFGTAVVVRDAAGAGAAPEGEMSMITDYDSSTSTLTMDAVTAAPASGDLVGIATPLFPLTDMIMLANIAMRKMGELDLSDRSITILADTLDYTLPIRKAPIQVRFSEDGDEWYAISNWRVTPATAGSAWTITLPSLTIGGTVEVLYRDIHPALTTYSSDIVETVHPELALNALIAEAFQWYNNQVGGSNPYYLQRENKAIQDLEASKVLYPVRRIVEQIQGMPHWTI